MERQKRPELSSRILNRVGSVFRRASRRTRSRPGPGVPSQQPIESSRSAESRTVAAPPAASPTVGTGDVNTTNIVPASSDLDPAAPPSTTHTETRDVSTSGPAPDTTRAGTVLWSEIQQEKARKLFAKYGLTLQPQEWMTPPPSDLQVQRVEKPIKMRVRRRCHRCQTTFGSDKICNNCQHARCKSCPRYPPARCTKEEKEARACALVRAKGKSPENRPSEPPKPALTTTLHPTPTQNPKNTRSILSRDSHFDGQDVIDGRPEQMTGVSSDNNKNNVPMERPLRVWRRPRMRVRYYCHNCDTMYAEGENLCTECGEAKGPQTRRDPPKKTKPPIDEEVLKRVQERLAQFNLAADNT